jgi:hypothetical protein
MGEFADFTLDSMDALEFYAQPDVPRLKQCKYCGKKRLHWEETRWGWRLFNKDGEQHTCQQYWKAREKKERKDALRRDVEYQIGFVSPRSNYSGNGEWTDFDEILGNFGDWGSQ